MPGPGHQAAVTQPVQQVIDAVEAVEHVEVLVDPLTQILTSANPVPRVRRGAVQVRTKRFFLIRGQVPVVAAAAIPEALQTVLVIPLNPLLQAAAAHRKGLGDLGRGVALQGQDDDLQTYAPAGVLLLAGHLLE